MPVLGCGGVDSEVDGDLVEREQALVAESFRAARDERRTRPRPRSDRLRSTRIFSENQTIATRSDAMPTSTASSAPSHCATSVTKS